MLSFQEMVKSIRDGSNIDEGVFRLTLISPIESELTFHFRFKSNPIWKVNSDSE